MGITPAGMESDIDTGAEMADTTLGTGDVDTGAGPAPGPGPAAPEAPATGPAGL